jgi:hypothetical protein
MNIILCLLINYLGYVISPARVDKTIFGAEQITEVFEVMNFSNDSLRIKVEFEDFDITEIGEVIFYEAGSIPNSLAPFTTINPEEFVIAPQKIEKVRVTFQMPVQTNTPEYYSMLLFKSQPIPTEYQPMIAIAGEIGSAIYYANGEFANKKAVFEQLNIPDDTIFCALRNSGNIHLRIKGESMVLKSDGKTISKDSIPEFVVLPGKIRNIKVPLSKTIAKGDTCITRIRLDYGAIELIEAERIFIR